MQIFCPQDLVGKVVTFDEVLSKKELKDFRSVGVNPYHYHGKVLEIVEAGRALSDEEIVKYYGEIKGEYLTASNGKAARTHPIREFFRTKRCFRAVIDRQGSPFIIPCDDKFRISVDGVTISPALLGKSGQVEMGIKFDE